MRIGYRLLICLLCGFLLAGCTSTADAELIPNASPNTSAAGTKAPAPALPDKLKKSGSGGPPVLQVYVVEDKKVREMDIETYVAGVLAGEMKNDWPMEALKAQAILARTFVLKFTTEKESKYEGADISTDIEEAQAYNAADVNDRIKQAVAETKGEVLSYEGEFPYAWFHAHSGGTTALAKEGLGYDEEEPPYTMIAKGQESDKAPEDSKTWSATFSEKEFLAACKKAGSTISSIDSVSVGKKGESGRALTLSVGGTEVDAAELRIALDSTKMRSTLLTNVKYENGSVSMAGKGYGHGVGMPQWGAYRLAESGMKGEEIVMQYFKNVGVVSMW